MILRQTNIMNLSKKYKNNLGVKKICLQTAQCHVNVDSLTPPPQVTNSSYCFTDSCFHQLLPLRLQTSPKCGSLVTGSLNTEISPFWRFSCVPCPGSDILPHPVLKNHRWEIGLKMLMHCHTRSKWVT